MRITRHLASLAILFFISLPANAETIKIGTAMALTGPAALIGQAELYGLQMAVEDINAKGGILGNTVALISADDAGQPATANTIARNQILNDGVKAIFGSSNSAVGAAVEALADRYQIPLLFFGSNDVSLTTTNFSRFAFQTSPSTYMEPRAVAAYVARKKYSKIFTISPDINFGHSYVANFLAGLKENGGNATIVGEQYPALGTTDYSSYISAALASNSDFVFVGLFGGDEVTFLRQAQRYGMFEKVPVGASGAMDVLLTLKGETPAGLLLWERSPFFAMNTPAIEDFTKRFRQRHNAWPSAWPILAYASLQVWAAGVVKAGSFDGPKLSAALSGSTVDTIRGKLTFRSCDHQADAPVYIGVVSKTVDPQYGFPLLEQITKIEASETIMTCQAAEALQRK